jgi:hypothetical protein
MALEADIEVLTEDAAEVAVGEEDGPRAAPAAQTVFFAMVRPYAADDGPASGAAIRRRVSLVQTVDVALTAAERTIGQPLDRLSHAAGQLAVFEQLDISRVVLRHYRTA